MTFIKKCSDLIARLESVLVIVLFCVMLLSIVLGVAFRYFLNSPLSWAEEVAIYTLVWITFIAGSMGIKRQQAATVTLVFDRLSGRVRRVVLAVGFAIITLFCLLVLVLSIKWVTAPSMLMQKSPTLGISMLYPYLCIPFGMICMAIHAFAFLLTAIRGEEEIA
ncbi:TRAP transporter small permease [Brevibacillus fulvus]|uniref:TRAP-type C4-dicarboxylate transport system permease small subunit n=1 Tax=Brevibacillus fulvus TaxID=1125967 RepID=A0A938XYF0_9BACL|nr:TRAP transporter small permease [Brevibacillus fulvus]MBM7589933.1 TRAP-type C4-dicarboxylate transport system permease small subunit [Brevibacillus fulvus]